MHAILLLIAALHGSVPRANDEIVATFLAAIANDDIGILERLTANRRDLYGEQFRSLREVFRRDECIDVESSTIVREEPDIITIDLDARALLRGERQELRALPTRWYLQTVSTPHGMRVQRIDDETTRRTERLLVAQTDGERTEVLEIPSADRRAIGRDLIDRLMDDIGGDAIHAAQSLADAADRDRDDVLKASALSAAAFIESVNQNQAAAMQRSAEARAAAAASGSYDAIAWTEQVSALLEDDAARASIHAEIAAETEPFLDDPAPALAALYRLHRAQLEQFRLGPSRDALTRMERLAERHGDREAAAWAIYGKSVLAATTSENEIATRLAESAAATGRLLRAGRLESTAESLIGKVATDPRQKIAHLRRAFDLAPPSALSLRTGVEYMLSEAFVEQNRLREADEVLSSVLPMVLAHPQMQRAANILYSAQYLRYRQGRFDESKKIAEIAIAEPSINQSMWLLWAIKSLLGRTMLECGDVDGAIDSLRAAVDLIEARRAMTHSSPVSRVRFLASLYGEPYRALIAALLRAQRVEEALDVVERVKARVLQETVSGNTDAPLLTTAEESRRQHLTERVVLLNRRSMLEGGRSDIRRDLQQARDELDTFNLDISLSHPQDAVMFAPRPFNLSAIHAATIVEYALDTEGIAVFVIRNGRATARRLPAAPDRIREAVNDLRNRASSGNLNYESQARALYRQLVAPLADLLPNRGQIVLIPDDFLWNVPFAMLEDSRGRLLVERFTLSSAPSITMLQAGNSRQAHRPQNELLAIGNPELARGTSLTRDPEASRELSAIHALYPTERSVLLTGSRARETTFKKMASDFRIIHVATHATVDDTSPLYSAVVLGAGKNGEDDGLLETREVKDLRLNADLVVLSACDTARGSVYRGEGVIGLSWAFLMSGARSTVVSQWRAASKATSLFMQRFHRRLRTGDTPANALRAAQLALRRDSRFSHPFFWASFVVVTSAEP